MVSRNKYSQMFKRGYLLILLILCVPCLTSSQNKNTADTVRYLNLDQCIVYALEHQPAVMQAQLGVSIAQKTNAINLSAWLPQVNLSGNLTHYNNLPTTLSANPLNPEGPLVQNHPGVSNTLIPQLSATQVIFNPDVLYAARSARLYVQLAQQSSDSTKINLIATVSKSFYGLLFTLEQMNVLKEDTARLAKNLSDTYHQYVGGIADKTDYKEATISLNNSRAQLKQARENVRPQYASLKQLMGFPVEKEFSVSFDTLQMMKQIAFDTTQHLDYGKRIEFQEIQTVKNIQQQEVRYYQSQFLPTVSAFYNYYYEFENNSFSELFPQAYPYSYVGATVNIPLFTGARRVESIQRAKMQSQQLEWAEGGLKARINSEYTAALAGYKTNLFDLNLMQGNVTMAKDVYGIVTLQYKQGVVAYLNVITAESNLISSEINYLNALFQVLLSKVDLEKALGNTSSKPTK
jgi:outer membrane protein TolC